MPTLAHTADPAVLVAALALGLGSSLHCLAMCGPLAAAVPLAPGAARWPRLITYNGGRLISYGLGGLLAAGLGGALLLAGGDGARVALTLLAAAFVVATVAGQAGWIPAPQALERWGRRLWARIAPVGRLAGTRGGLPGVLVLGLLWGWLPCGMVYAALALATATTDPLRGTTVMLAFGLGTLPSMLGAGWFAGRLRGSPGGRQAWQLRQAMAATVIGLTLWSTVSALQPHAGHGHGHAPAPVDGATCVAPRGLTRAAADQAEDRDCRTPRDAGSMCGSVVLTAIKTRPLERCHALGRAVPTATAQHGAGRAAHAPHPDGTSRPGHRTPSDVAHPRQVTRRAAWVT